jgi:hypothetical protein
MTFPLFLTILTARKTSIPAPEPKSTNIYNHHLNEQIWLVGLPHPTPSIDD